MRTLAHSHSLLLRTLAQPAPGRPRHHWQLSQRDLGNGLFPGRRFSIGLRVDLDPAVDEVDLDLTLIIEIPEPAHHGVDLDDRLIRVLMIGGGLVQLIGELELPPLLVAEVVADPELMLEGDGELAVFGDDLLDVVGETIIGVDLLLD